MQWYIHTMVYYVAIENNDLELYKLIQRDFLKVTW